MAEWTLLDDRVRLAGSVLDQVQRHVYTRTGRHVPRGRSRRIA